MDIVRTPWPTEAPTEFTVEKSSWFSFLENGGGAGIGGGIALLAAGWYLFCRKKENLLEIPPETELQVHETLPTDAEAGILDDIGASKVSESAELAEKNDSDHHPAFRNVASDDEADDTDTAAIAVAVAVDDVELGLSNGESIIINTNTSAAWDILQNPNFFKEQGAYETAQAWLNEQGVLSENREDLSRLNADDLQEKIATLLKPVPESKFRDFMNI